MATQKVQRVQNPDGTVQEIQVQVLSKEELEARKAAIRRQQAAAAQASPPAAARPTAAKSEPTPKSDEAK